MAKDQDIPLEDLSDMIGDPDLAYAAAPAGVLRLADFLHRTGRLKRRPAVMAGAVRARGARPGGKLTGSGPRVFPE